MNRIRILACGICLMASPFALASNGPTNDSRSDDTKSAVDSKPAAKPDDNQQPQVNAPDPTAPSAHHDRLNVFVGDWDCSMTFLFANQDPLKFKGTSHMESILGGRFIEQKYYSSINEMPFEGRGLFGYDALHEEYVTSWIDSQSTSVMIERGKVDMTGKKFEFTGEQIDVATKMPILTRTTITIQHDNKFVMKMFKKVSPNAEVQWAELVYTRQNPPAKPKK